MPNSEFMSWMAFYSKYPFGIDRDNFHAGVVASTVANCHSKKQFKPSDFMLKGEDERRHNNLSTFVTGLRSLAKPKKTD